jgi:hypothetical protein
VTLEPLRCIVTANASVGRDTEEFDMERRSDETGEKEKQAGKWPPTP